MGIRGIYMSEGALPKGYEFAEVESHWYKYWEEKDFFRADETSPKPPYSIVIPPPNVTGQLHMGHALNNTLQDILCRYKRLKGFEVLWVPGTDHAGIATQNVVERQLGAEGLTRHGIGREAFLQRVWEWRARYGGIIINQLKRLGASCDWSRERFTMDEGLSQAVRQVFVSLYNEGLIYRGKRMINWCPRCMTALANIEVEGEELDSFLYYIRYPLVSGKGALVVATTRPETMLGDTAVAVNPEDHRYKALIGQKVVLPIVGRHIPVIARFLCRARVRHRGAQGYSRPRFQRFRALRKAQPRTGAGHRRTRNHDRTDRPLRRNGPVCLPQADSQRPRKRRLSCKNRALQAPGRTLLPLPKRGRADALASVVRCDQTSCRSCH